MFRFLWFVFIGFTVGCRVDHHPVSPNPSELAAALMTKQAAWIADIKKAQSTSTSWLSDSDCDGTLWEGEALAAGAGVPLELAEWAPGEIHRRPQVDGECYPAESASTVSSDMLVGYMVGEYSRQGVGALERLEAYGEAHKDVLVWVMGQPMSAHEVRWSPAGYGLLARAVAKLGGPKKDYSVVEDPCLPVASDFEYHDQALGLWLGGQIDGGVTDVCLAAVDRNARLLPQDALMQAIKGVYTGDEAPALELLTADSYQCPSYVRPVAIYCAVHKAFAAKIVLSRFGG